MHKLEISKVVDFLSKECKNNEHTKCCSKWVGLGFRVDCNCLCHQHQSSVDIKNVHFGEKFIESDRNNGKSVVESNIRVDTDNEFKILKKSIEPVDKSFRGFSQQLASDKGEE